jgi:hypothetical protein
MLQRLGVVAIDRVAVLLVVDICTLSAMEVSQHS